MQSNGGVGRQLHRDAGYGGDHHRYTRDSQASCAREAALAEAVALATMIVAAPGTSAGMKQYGEATGTPKCSSSLTHTCRRRSFSVQSRGPGPIRSAKQCSKTSVPWLDMGRASYLKALVVEVAHLNLPAVQGPAQEHWQHLQGSSSGVQCQSTRCARRAHTNFQIQSTPRTIHQQEHQVSWLVQPGVLGDSKELQAATGA